MSEPADAVIDIHALLGRGIRARREALGLRQEDAAQRFRAAGLTTWRRSAVAQIEAGTRHPSLADLLLVALALECTLADLVPADSGTVAAVGNGARIRADAVRLLLAGDFSAFDSLPADAVHTPDDDQFAVALGEAAALRERLEPQLRVIHDHAPRRLFHGDRRSAFQPTAEAEARAAERLGVEPPVLKFAARALWGTGFEAERDHRAGEGDASHARRGHATRAMLGELREFLDACGITSPGPA